MSNVIAMTPPATRMIEAFHPLADIFPMLSGAPFDVLVDSIKQNGLREPIWRHQDGRIIDGRNRWCACREASVECRSNTYVGSDDALLAFIIDMNLHRRHLNESQRAMVAARLATLRREDTLKQNQRPDGSIDLSTASQMLNVSEASTKRARVVLDAGDPELVKLVDDGKLAVSAAATLAKSARMLDAGVSPAKSASKPKDACGKKTRKTLAVYDRRAAAGEELTRDAVQEEAGVGRGIVDIAFVIRQAPPPPGAAGKMVSVAEVRAKIIPIVEKLANEARKHMAEMSSYTVGVAATQIKNIIAEWSV
jgi:ParB-like chromosome segregation protein Spo0J